MRLNLGAGDDRLEGHLSVDLRADAADVVADCAALPFGDGTAQEVVALDILEHFPRARIPEVLAEWRRVLAPGGRLRLRVPNLARLGGQLASGRNVAETIENIYGGHRWGPDGAWDAHHWGWTPDTLARDLRAAGFRMRLNDLRHNMGVVASASPR